MYHFAHWCIFLSFKIMQHKNPGMVHIPLFFRYVSSSNHCNKHLYLQGVVHVPLLLISTYLLCCVVASTCDNRGGSCTTLVIFNICLFRNLVGNLFDFRGGTCTTFTKVLKIWILFLELDKERYMYPSNPILRFLFISDVFKTIGHFWTWVVVHV